MKEIKKLFQFIIGAAALIARGVIAIGRLVWIKVRNLWRKCSKAFRRLVAALSILLASGFLLLVAYAIYDDCYGRRSWKDKDLSEFVVARAYMDDTYRVYNYLEGKYTTPRLSWICDTPEGDSLTVYALPGRRGFLNIHTGKIAIDAKSNDYTAAWLFSEGLAAVLKDGRIGFINRHNEIVIPCMFDYCHFRSLNYQFTEGACIMTNKDGEYGLIDSKGKWILEPSYDEIYSPEPKRGFIVGNEGKYGLFSLAGTFTLPMEYDSICFAEDDAGLVLSKDGRKWQIDFEGNMVNPFMFDATYWLKYPSGYYECGEISYSFADYAKYEVNDRIGLMNRQNGKPLTPAIYDAINMLSANVFEALDPDTGNWIMLNSEGNKITAY